MQKKTALYILRELVKSEMLRVEHTTFHLQTYPEEIDPRDVVDAFEIMRLSMNVRSRGMLVSHRASLSIWTSDEFFEKLYRLLYTYQKLVPKSRYNEVLEGQLLPNLFVNSDKTQIRQIPLATEEPWPFRFLLELGGMIVCKTDDVHGLRDQLGQFLNNYPQYRVRVAMHKWDTGEKVLSTYWFAHVPKNEIKGNLNVPQNSG